MLAGGRSTRFGSDKLSAPYRGRPLLTHVVETLATACFEVVVVLSPSGTEHPVPGGATVRFVRDSSEGEGPLAGLGAALPEAAMDLAIAAGGDMPELSVAVLGAMIRHAADADAVALAEGDHWRPLPCVLRVRPASDAARVLLAGEERSLLALLSALDVSVVPEGVWTALDPERRTLVDVDVPADLDR